MTLIGFGHFIDLQVSDSNLYAQKRVVFGLKDALKRKPNNYKCQDKE